MRFAVIGDYGLTGEAEAAVPQRQGEFPSVARLLPAEPDPFQLLIREHQETLRRELIDCSHQLIVGCLR